MATTEATRLLFFDVINSVKGGSGKSSVSLLLAAALKKAGASVYIIDMDLRGSSWHSNFDISGQLSNYISINDLMDVVAFPPTSYPFVDIPLEVTISRAKQRMDIPAAIVNTNKSKPVDEVETDLFERAIFQIIEYVIVKEAASSPTSVHIIFDMPPSYEQHAERVLEHLLLNGDSPLMRKFDNPKKEYCSYDPYVVNLIMLSAISTAHLSLNELYVDRFAKAKKFSSRVDQLLTKGRLHLLFWGNDVVGTASDPNVTAVRDNFINKLTAAQDSAAKKLTNSVDLQSKIASFPPIIIDHNAKLLHDIQPYTNPSSTDKSLSEEDMAVFDVFSKDTCVKQYKA